MIVSCGGGSSSSIKDTTSTELVLNFSESNFTSPSLFTIHSNKTFICDSANIYYNNVSRPLVITAGYRLNSTNETICALSDLPKDINSDSTLKITYQRTDNNPKTFTEAFNISPSDINQLPKNSVLNFYDKTYQTYSDHDLHDIQLSKFDYSGAASSVQYIFKDKFDLDFSEFEVMNDLLIYGETEAIIERRGFSLLDMKRVFENYGYSAAGFRMVPEEGFDYLENDIGGLQTNIPFISPISFEGTLGFVTIIKLNNQNITFLHPHLGYIQVPFSDLSSGKIRNNEDWIVLIPAYIQE